MAASRCPLHSLARRAMAVAESEARRAGVSAEPTRSRPCRALKNSYDGLTFFAPNDNAFTKLKTGTLNGLTDQQKIQLLLYHVLPRYYSVTTFQTASNPLPTEASGPGGMYSINVTTTTTSHLVNMSTGVHSAPASSTSGTLLAPASSKRPARLPGRARRVPARRALAGERPPRLRSRRATPGRRGSRRRRVAPPSRW